jgi:hypothetical protein
MLFKLCKVSSLRSFRENPEKGFFGSPQKYYLDLVLTPYSLEEHVSFVVKRYAKQQRSKNRQ